MNRKANRKKHYNYSSAGYYFVTICTKDRLLFFGKIEDDKMILNKSGEIVKKCWLDIPEHFSIIKIEEFVIMPNHFHGIIIIDDFVWNRHARSIQNINENRQHQKLPVIIGSFKSVITKLIHRKYENGFQWQKSYYDHIIRNEPSLNNIRQYIRQNPQNWDKVKNNLLIRN